MNYYFINLSLLIIIISFINVSMAVPSENCLINQQCTTFCQSYGYSHGTCRTRLSIIPLIKRFCHCSVCEPKYCQNYCNSIGRKYASCICFNYPNDQRFNSNSILIQQQNENSIVNDCNDNKLYCQCGL